jgi:hypothetical protein
MRAAALTIKLRRHPAIRKSRKPMQPPAKGSLCAAVYCTAGEHVELWSGALPQPAAHVTLSPKLPDKGRYFAARMSTMA